MPDVVQAQAGLPAGRPELDGRDLRRRGRPDDPTLGLDGLRGDERVSWVPVVGALLIAPTLVACRDLSIVPVIGLADFKSSLRGAVALSARVTTECPV